MLKDSVKHPGSVAERHAENRGAQVDFVYRNAIKGYSAKLSPEEAAAVERDPNVAAVEQDARVKIASQLIPTGVNRVFAPDDADIDIDGVNDYQVDVDVAIIDTGIELNHPDLNVAGSTDCTTGSACVDGNGWDSYFHGTHVAGTVGALDNGSGVVGVAPGARLWGVRVLYGGYGLMSWVIAGVDWVTAHADQIEVANMSLGCYECESSAVLDEAIASSVDAGVVYVVAAGNDNESASKVSPANNPDVITVAALSDFDGEPGGLAEPGCRETYFDLESEVDDTTAWFSNWGEPVDIVAPGSCIKSTVPTYLWQPYAGYWWLSGTSMASPHVAGAAALLASESNPDSREDVEAIRGTLIEEGNFDWTEDSLGGNWGAPLLDVTDFPAKLISNMSGDPKWSASATPKLGSELDAISCVSTSDCVAVGINGHGGSGVDGSLMRRWDGETWTTELAIPADSDLSGVSCTSSVDCAAVGSIVVSGVRKSDPRIWSGSVWTAPGTRPHPVGATSSELTGVSCAYSYDCMAVGSYIDGSGVKKPLSATWDGSSWTLQSTPIPSEATASELTAVSCSTYGGCMAVGSYVEGTVETALVEKWDGSWTLQSPPVPSEAISSELTGVSCSPYGDCMAVGSYVEGTVETALVERWDASAWSLEAAPSPSGATAGALADVACVAPSDCVVVGSYSEGSEIGSFVEDDEQHALAQSWDGSSWTEHTIEEEAAGHRAMAFTGVSCDSSTGACSAVGYHTGAGQPRQFVVYQENENTWTAGDTGQSDLQLNDVHCTAQSACMAVGTLKTMNSIADEETVSQVWDGTEWVLAPRGSTVPLEGRLLGVHCTAANACVAVGQHENSYPLIQRWDGAEWAQETNLSPNESGTTMSDVACSSPKYCFAVGSNISGGSYSPRSLVQWNGGSWTGKSMPVPSGYTDVTYESIECLSSTYCIAVGGGEGPEGYRALKAVWDGSKWWPAALPFIFGETHLTDIVCASVVYCVAVGYTGSGTTAQPLILAWNGYAWSVKEGPAEVEYGALDAVSCTTGRCIAAGQSYEGGLSENRQGLTISWDLTEWAVLPSPFDVESVGALSCVGDTCAFVGGDYSSETGTHQAFAAFHE